MHGWSPCMVSILWRVWLKMPRALSLGSDIQYCRSHVHYCWVVITISTMPYSLGMHGISCQVTDYPWYGLRLPCSIQQKQYYILDKTHPHCNAINISSSLVLLYTQCLCAQSMPGIHDGISRYVRCIYMWLGFHGKCLFFLATRVYQMIYFLGKLHRTKGEKCGFGSYTTIKFCKLNSRLFNRNFLTWLGIGFLHSYQPSRIYVFKHILDNVDFHPKYREIIPSCALTIQVFSHGQKSNRETCKSAKYPSRFHYLKMEHCLCQYNSNYVQLVSLARQSVRRFLCEPLYLNWHVWIFQSQQSQSERLYTNYMQSRSISI